ncbi:MAG: aspartate--tRNA(Asn) ligase [Clostridiales bacterium]|nr:aspartate--tRNA(Asn) ligase [Clostridiales bacterium]
MKTVDGKNIKRDLCLFDILALKENEREGIYTHGTIYNIRDIGGVTFIILRKINGLIQCVYDKKGTEDEKRILRVENSIRVKGNLVENKKAPHGLEILVEDIELISVPEKELPIKVNDYKLDIALENEIAVRPIILRNEKRRSTFKIEEGLVRGFRQYLEKNDFTEIFSPKIVSSGAEGGSNIFKLEYFGKKAYLAQSPQFYKQTMIPIYERVFEIAPVFRAEKHNTMRHLNEYISVDFEMGFIKDFYDVINMETGMIKYALNYLKEEYAPYLEILQAEVPEVESIPCVSFKEAKEMAAEKYNRSIRDPYDLEPEEERLIGKLFKENYNSDFVFVTHYPVKKRPFYTMDDPENPKYTLSFDLLFRGLEVTTGGQRIHNYKEQIEKMKSKGLDPSDFESYLMLHKYGCPPHGGLGMGLERFTMQLLGFTNIRQTSMFPRDTLRLVP